MIPDGSSMMRADGPSLRPTTYLGTCAMSASTMLPGTRVGKYLIQAHLATGGMGTVYRAMDEALGRVVALKVLTPELSSNPILVERFRREARAAARLQHKN